MHAHCDRLGTLVASQASHGGVFMLQQICLKCLVQHDLLLCCCEFIRITAQVSKNLLWSPWSCWVGVGCTRFPDCYYFKAGRSRLFELYPHCSLQYCWSANRKIQDGFPQKSRRRIFGLYTFIETLHLSLTSTWRAQLWHVVLRNLPGISYISSIQSIIWYLPASGGLNKSELTKYFICEMYFPKEFWVKFV